MAIELLGRVRRTVDENRLLPSGSRVVAGVSGGPDSVCLLHVLRTIAREYNIEIQVAHLHHGSRGTASDADASFVRALSARWNVPCVVDREDVTGFARRHGLAFEEAARCLRYRFLARVAASVGASRVATGHNADDQAETVLMHLLRGSGMAGLRGMLPATQISSYRLVGARQPGSAGSVRRGHGQTGRGGDKTSGSTGLRVVRPLLEVPRASIEDYCADRHLDTRFDHSNLDTTFFRNRLRHELLPTLETYNPNIRARLCRTADVVAADYEILETIADQAWVSANRPDGDGVGVTFDLDTWRGLPKALQRATLRRAVFELRPCLRDLGFVHIEDARRIGLTGCAGARATLPAGLELAVDYAVLVIGDAGASRPNMDRPRIAGLTSLDVKVPGTVWLDSARWALEGDVVDQWDLESIGRNSDRWTAYFDLANLDQPLRVRNRRPGDVIRPLGLSGHRVKVSALLTNQKVPRGDREDWPLLVAGDEVAWVCGARQAEPSRVRPDTTQVLRLRFRRRRASNQRSPMGELVASH